MAKYHIVVNGQAEGPFELHELLINGLKPDTLVWTDGMTTWLKAQDVAEVAAVFSAPAPTPAAEPEPTPEPAEAPAAPEHANQHNEMPSSTSTADRFSGYSQNMGEDTQPIQARPVQAQPMQGQPAQPAYGQPAQPVYGQPTQPVYGQPIQGQPAQPLGGMARLQPDTSSALAWIVTLLSWTCCCNPISGILGIISLVAGSSARQAYRNGDLLTCESQADRARKFALYALIAMIVYALISFIYVINDPELRKSFMDAYNQ